LRVIGEAQQPKRALSEFIVAKGLLIFEIFCELGQLVAMLDEKLVVGGWIRFELVVLLRNEVEGVAA
jgi:hypothetical protein